MSLPVLSGMDACPHSIQSQTHPSRWPTWLILPEGSPVHRLPCRLASAWVWLSGRKQENQRQEEGGNQALCPSSPVHLSAVATRLPAFSFTIKNVEHFPTLYLRNNKAENKIVLWWFRGLHSLLHVVFFQRM